jgi:hypothetical protein
MSKHAPAGKTRANSVEDRFINLATNPVALWEFCRDAHYAAPVKKVVERGGKLYYLETGKEVGGTSKGPAIDYNLARMGAAQKFGK